MCYCAALGAEGKLLYSGSLTWKGFDVPAPRAPLPFLRQRRRCRASCASCAASSSHRTCWVSPRVTLGAGVKSCLCTQPLLSFSFLKVLWENMLFSCASVFQKRNQLRSDDHRTCVERCCLSFPSCAPPRAPPLLALTSHGVPRQEIHQ